MAFRLERIYHLRCQKFHTYVWIKKGKIIKGDIESRKFKGQTLSYLKDHMAYWGRVSIRRIR